MSIGVMKESRDLLLEFWDSLHIWGTVQARNFKFGVQIDHEGLILRKKNRPKGSQSGHVICF